MVFWTNFPQASTYSKLSQNNEEVAAWLTSKLRKRHVKCDEAKPACNNCLSLRGSKGRCGGYGDRPASVTPDPVRDDTRSPSVSPESSSTVAVTTGLGRTYDAMLRELLDGEGLFSSDIEKSYFNDWIRFAHDTPSGIYPVSLWVTTLPQLTRHDRPLRYGAMAIGALIKTAAQATDRRPLDALEPALIRRRSRDMGGAGDSHSHIPAETSQHYADGVTYYIRALQLQARQQQRAQDQAASPAQLWAAVLSSALFACFESLRGDRHGALKHVSHGITLVSELLRHLGQPLVPALRPMVRDNDQFDFAPAPRAAIYSLLRDFERLETQCRTFVSSRTIASSELSRDPLAITEAGTASPATWPSSSSSMRSTMQLATGHPGYTSAAYYQTLRYADTAYSVMNLPARMESILEARGHWERALRRIWGFYPGIWHAADAMLKEEGVDGLALLDDEALERRIDDFVLDPKLEARRNECLDLARRMEAAFTPLFEELAAAKEEEPQVYLQALGLKLQRTFAILSVEVPRYCSLAEVRAATPRYAELLALVEEMMSYIIAREDGESGHRSGRAGRPSSQPQIRGFSMDMGVSWYLIVVALGCRDLALRQRALSILAQYPRVDGFFSTRALHAMITRALEVEWEEEAAAAAAAAARSTRLGMDITTVDADGGAPSTGDGQMQACLPDDEEARWRRLRRREFAFGDDGRTVIYRYLRKDWAAGGAVAFVEEVADYTLPAGEIRWLRRPYTEAVHLLSDLG